MQKTSTTPSTQGVTVHPVDANGRITLKEHQDDALPREVFLTQDLDSCILLMEPGQWKAFSDALEDLPPLDPDVADLKRLMLAPVVKVRIDKQRRLKLPEALRDWAGLKPGESRTLVLDVGTRLEIWEEERYRSYMGSRAKDLKEVARRIWGSAPAKEAEDEAQ